jgi:predicted MFS family arabinose efflux permease
MIRGQKAQGMGKAAISETSSNRGLVRVLGLAGFVSAADNWFVSPSLPAIASGFGTSVAMAASILTAYMIPYGFMQPVYGFFSDSHDKVKLLRIIVLGLALGTAGSALAPSLPLLCALRAATGFFAAGIIAVSLSLIGDRVPEAERQAHVGRFMGIVFAGQGLSAGLGGVLTRYASWRGAFAFFAAAALLAALLLRTLPAGKPGSQGRMRDFPRQCGLALSSARGRVIFPLAFFVGFLLVGIYGYLGAFLHERIHLDYMQSGIVVMFYGFACLAGGRRVGALAGRAGKKGAVILGESLALASAALLCASFLLQSWAIALIATICLGLGYIAAQSTLATMAFDVASECRGLPSGLIGFGLFCGGGLGSMAGGGLLTLGSYQAIWMAFGLGIVLLIAVTSRLKLS